MTGSRGTIWVVGLFAGLIGLEMISSCIVVRGRQGDRILFPHAGHEDIIDDCWACHEGIDDVAVTSRTRRALEAACMKCHQDRKDDCSFCHTDPGSAGVFPSKNRQLSFSHADHLFRTDDSCAPCHTEVHGVRITDEVAGVEGHPAIVAMPAHEQCFSCHEMRQFNDDMQCQNCHESLFQYGLEPHEKFSHSIDWVATEHAAFLRGAGNSTTCAQCHGEPFCGECHANDPAMRLWERSPERVTRTFIHAGDYVHSHMWDLRADPASCMRCHSQQFCSDCHDSRGITEGAARNRSDGFRFHGPGVLQPGSPDYHGDAARRDIVSCAACHNEGTAGNCVECHRVGEFGGNPHPPGFSSRLSRTGAPVCRLCHDR